MKMKILILLILSALLLPSQTGCDEQVSDVKANGGQYVEAGKTIIKIAKDTDVDNSSGVETAKNIVDSVAGVATTVSFIPGAQSITVPLVAGLTAISTILGYFTVKKNKEIKVVTADRDKHVAIADDYGGALEAAIMSGEDDSVANVEILEAVMDTQTKSHFNAKGLISLKG